MLSPKRIKFRKQHKGRIHGLAKGGYALNLGDYGLKALTPERITARQIEAARRAITREMKRAGHRLICFLLSFMLMISPAGSISLEGGISSAFRTYAAEHSAASDGENSVSGSGAGSEAGGSAGQSGGSGGEADENTDNGSGGAGSGGGSRRRGRSPWPGGSPP